MSPQIPPIKMFEDADELAEQLAIEFLNSVHQAVENEKKFYVALSGGSTPAHFFHKLASEPYREKISWQSVHFFWGDERCVPPNHSDSNYRMTKQNLLDYISLPAENVHRILGEKDPTTEAKRYAQEIESLVPKNDSKFPRFDWILLGLGTDGHTASIFAGSDVLDDHQNICTATIHPESGQKRITLTLPVINNARRISFLVTGEHKASIVAQILVGVESSERLPVSLIRPTNGNLEWYLDREAGKVIRG